MELNDFIGKFAAEFDETDLEEFMAQTDYKELDEWNSLTALSIISMVDEEYSKTITGADLRANKTIEDLFNYVKSL